MSSSEDPYETDEQQGLEHDGAHLAQGAHPHDHQLGTSTEGKHAWKTRPPYRIHEPNDRFDVKCALFLSPPLSHSFISGLEGEVLSGLL